MRRLYLVLSRLSIAFWLGGGLFLAAVAAPAAFSGSEDPRVAAGIVGRMLSTWHWISILAPLVALLSPTFRRKLPVILIVVAVTFANLQWLIDNQIHEIRLSAGVSVSELEEVDPTRRRFGMLHGMSMLLLIGQLLCAGGVVASDRGETGRMDSGE